MADAEEKLTLSVRLIRSFEYRNIKVLHINTRCVGTYSTT